jgi:hypothetical protein
MRKSEARAADGRIVPVNHTPLRDPKLASIYAEKLSEGFADVVVRSVGDRIEVVAKGAK